eukprot:g358.t1
MQCSPLLNSRTGVVRPGLEMKPVTTPMLRSLLTRSSSPRQYGFHRFHPMEERLFQAATVDSIHTPDVKETVEKVEEVEDAEAPYDWFKNWYPIQTVFNLETDRPNRLQLLDKWLVVWKGHSGKWIVMDDQCPHRMAPLSEGRIEKDGNLLCSYHAWRFNEDGKCVKIPHAEDEKAHEVACNSSRSAVHTYPVKSRAGLLWVWPDDAPTAFEDAENSIIPMDDELAAHCEEKTIDGDQWFQRVVPYNQDVIMENVLDPSHFIVSHHGSFPLLNRYEAKPLKMKPTAPIMPEAAFATYEHDAVLPLHEYGRCELRLPNHTILENSKYKGDDNWIRQHAIITPLTKHLCRAFIYSYTSAMVAGTKSNIKSPVLYQLPAWQMHSLFNDVLDGDVAFLHLQDKMLRRTGRKFAASKSFYVPSSADVMVMLYRKWFEGPGRSGEQFGNATPYDESRDMTQHEYLDRYTQHTIHCKACRNALSRFQFVLGALKYLSIAAIVAGSCILMGMFDGTPLYWKNVLKNRKVVLSFGSAVVITLVRMLLGRYVHRSFYYKPWAHPDNH